MAGWIDSCCFTPVAGGTTDWTFASVVQGYQSPTAAGAQNGRLYKVRAESADLSQWEESEGAYNGGTGVFARTTVLFNSQGTTAKVNFSSVPQVAVIALKEDLLATDESCLALGMTNGQLSASATAGALTVSVLTTAGNAPSVLDPIFFYFRDNTVGNGDVVRIAVTSALSVVIGSGNTLGVVSFARLYIVALNNAGTVQLGAFIASGANGIWCPQENLKYTTSVPGSSAQTIVSTSAISTAAPWRFIGELEWTAALTPGTWVVPNIVQLWTAGMKKPGDLVQSIFDLVTATNLSGINLLSYLSLPTSTTGNQFMSQAITPVSAANRLSIDAKGMFCNTHTGGNWCAMTLVQSGVSNALSGDVVFQTTATGGLTNSIHYEMLAATASSTTFSVYAGGFNAGTHYMNFDGTVGMFGGVANSYLRIQEFKG
jgi:hypothetical protein